MKSHATASDLVRQCYAAYESKDRKVIEKLLSDDFRFSSPLDDRIDKALYMRRCWPNSENIRAFHIEQLFEKDNEVLVRYEGERFDGGKWRCTEFFRVEGGRIAEVQVYFGSLLTPANRKATDEARIRELVEDRGEAVRTRKVEGATPKDRR
jgi:ketosteroid isomerase-like protein